jgi:hypothetical protein
MQDVGDGEDGHARSGRSLPREEPVNGMSITGIGIDWQHGIKGLVLLAAAISDVYNKNNL